MEYVDIHTYVILDVMFILYIVVYDIWEYTFCWFFWIARRASCRDDPGESKTAPLPWASTAITIKELPPRQSERTCKMESPPYEPTGGVSKSCVNFIMHL